MNSGEPTIKNIQLCKTISDLKLYRSVNKQILAIENDIDIRYKEPNEDDISNGKTELGVSLECDIHNSEDADTDKTGEIKALIEVVYTVYLDYYSHEYLDYVMSSVWPYLRSAAELQLQLLGLNPIAKRLPYKVKPDK